jgi:nitroimidazol reductase NimA-like FMN-containing flavoprotein (pyridoxamine 5'-phosphate oxidase superfamily)
MEYTRTDRSTVRRLPKRASYDAPAIHAILDEALVAHVGFAIDGKPFVIPMNYGRSGDTLFLHGSAASRLAKSLAQGIDVCVEVTLLDGLVLARSAFHHSMNYRSVVLYGTARAVVDQAEKLDALRVISDHIIPGRWEHVRGPNENEMRATTVLELQITEASAKVRTGPPVDDAEDYALPVWAGVIPIRVQAGEPVADEQTTVAPPGHVSDYRRG